MWSAGAPWPRAMAGVAAGSTKSEARNPKQSGNGKEETPKRRHRGSRGAAVLVFPLRDFCIVSGFVLRASGLRFN
jgi:hypothetical protein